MKKSLGRVLGLSLTVLLVISLMTGSLLSAYQTPEGGSLFTDVTGSMDFSQLMQQYFNNGVLSGSQVKTYEKRTVIVSLDQAGLTDYAGDESVSDFAASEEGQKKTQELYAEQDRLLETIREAGIEYTLKHRYVAIDNAVAIEVDTSYVSELRRLGGVDSVVITRAYAAPKTVETSGSGAAVSNITSVYGTGVYDSSGALKDGLDGSGMVVAIIDTGLDYTHAAFQDMPAGSNPVRFTEEDIARILATKELCAEEKQLLNFGKLSVSDVYINAKVPFAYDYADNDADVYPSYSNHGTHVAGIVAGHDASGYTDKDGNHVDEEFIGVAPEAQLVICKVFTDDLEDSDLGGAETEDILTALEDCMLLGVDVINMSLGTTCGFTTSDDGDDEGEYLNRIYTAIGEQGINLLCAASNDYSAGYGSVFGTNLATNPDSGTIGSPSTYASALSVASISGKKSDYLLANGTLPVFFENSNDENSLPFDFIEQMLGKDGTTGEFEYVVIPGVGLASDYTAGVQELVKGRVALVKRGNSTFQEKVEIAKSFGAVAIIVYNNVAGTVRMSLGDVEEPIPAISIGMNAGEAMVSAATARVGKFKLDTTYKAGPFMSDFSSWGSTPDLKLKPEITAHGGEITSAVPGGYTEMSGTSMACPNMAGVTALVRAYVKSLWPELSPVEVTRRVNQLMMSTATTVYDKEGLPYSPRKQGSGLGSLDNSRFTQAYLWTDNASIDYRPKVELGDDKEKKGVYSLSFKLTNFGTTALSFKTQSLFMTETLALGGLAVAEQAYMLDDEAALWTLDGKALADGESFTVSAGATATLTLTLTLSDAEKTYIDESFKNGMYVEGFAKLLSETDEQCDLVLPFMGFYGDWSQAPMLDYSAYELAKFQQDSSIPDDEKPQASVWATQPYITYYNDEYVVPMGSFLYVQDPNADQIYADEEHNAISCFNEFFGENSINNYMTAYRFKGLYAGLLRNARSVNYQLINATTGEVLMDETSYRIGKSYSNGGSSTPALIELEIDPLDLDIASGEKYTMTFEFHLDYEDGKSTKNTYSFDFYADYESPVLQDVRVRYYDYKDGNKTRQRIYLDLDVFDNHYAQSVMLTYLEDGELKLATDYVTPVLNANKNGTTTVSIEITDLYEKYKDSLYVQVDDYALNHSVYWLNLSEDNQSLAPDSFELAEGEESINLDVYETHTVKLNYEGDGNISNFKWSSNDRRIVDVKNGEIVGLAPGTASVTVESSGGYRKTISVTVSENRKTLATPVISFGAVRDGDGAVKKAQGTLSMYPGMALELEIVGDPWYYPVEELELKWETTNPKVATVDEHGNVKTLEKGTAVIKASIVIDGAPTAYTATVTLRVQDPFEVSGYSLIKYHGAGGVVVIPTDKNIMMIGEEAFKDNHTITDIVIPKTVTSIGKNAFENCTALKRVYFVDTEAQPIADADVSVIYQRAFYGCTSLELLDLSNVKVVTLGRECFANCTSLSEIRRMDKISTAYDSCFANCTSLTSLDLSGLYVCGTGAFRGCASLSDIKTGWATRFGDYAFSGCVGLKELTLSAAQIGAYAFEGCDNLRAVHLTPEADGSNMAITIGAYAFAGCGSLTSFTFDEGCRVISIGDAALADTALTRFDMPNGLTAWGAGILSGTPATELTIGDDFDLESIRLVGIPFDRLTIRLEDGCTKYTLQDGVLYNADMTKLLLVFGETDEVTIPATVTSIGSFAFAGSQVTSVSIPATVTELGESAFADSAVTAITFADDSALTAIPDYAFFGSKLAQITLPASVQKIGEYAFADSNLSDIRFAGNAVESIGDMAFSGCVHLVSVTLPDGVSVMGEAVFASCTRLTSATLPSVQEIGEYTFLGCSALTTVRFGENAATAGDFTCYGCTALTTVELGGATTELGDDTFFGCTALESIDLRNVTVIGDETFTGCSALGTVTGLERVKIIGDMAFYNNNAIKTLNLAAATHIGKGAFAVENGGVAYTTLNIPSVEVIGAMAFAGGKETTVTIPASLTTLGYGAFSSSRLLTAFTVEEGSEKFFALDGVLYANLAEAGRYELCAFPGAKSVEGGVYTVLDGTTSIKGFALSGLSKKTAPSAVILPWSVKMIGTSAFYDSGIRDYTFNSIQAPTLACVYREDVMEIMEAAASGSTVGSVAVNGLFYANFDTLLVHYIDMVGGTSDLVMHIPENGVGYDNYVYATYFGESTSLGVVMDDTTRAAIEAIEALESAETVRTWMTWEINDENLARVQAFSAAVKEARRLYGNIVDETQKTFVSADISAKLTAVETELRAVKNRFGIRLTVSDIRYNSTYKKQYTEGETFDMTGLVLTVVYDDGSTEQADMSRLTLKTPTGVLSRYDMEVQFEYRYGDGADEVKTVRIPVTVTADGGAGNDPDTNPDLPETGTSEETSSETDVSIGTTDSSGSAVAVFVVTGIALILLGVAALIILQQFEKKGREFHPAIKWVIYFLIVAGAILLLAGWFKDSSAEDPIVEMDATISYYANGGSFENNMTQKTVGYDAGTFPLNIGFQTLTNGNAKINDRPGYAFEGWYLPLTDEAGNLVYEDEAKTVVKTGEAFDFTKRVQQGDDVRLYAKWRRDSFVNVLLAGVDLTDKDGNTYAVGSLIKELVFTNGSVSKFSGDKLLSLKGKAYTFVQYYTDEACTTPVTWPIKESETEREMTVYAKFVEGDWEIVSEKKDAKKMLENLAGNKQYLLINDIDLEGETVSMPQTVSATIEGGGHTLSGFTVERKGVKESGASLFGTLKATACIRNLTMTGVTLNIKVANNAVTQLYFLGQAIESGAEVSGLCVRGRMIVDHPEDAIVLNLQPTSHDAWILGGDTAPLTDGRITAEAECEIDGTTYRHP